MQSSNNILLIIWVLIAIPSIVFTQKKNKVCDQDCPSDFICGFGDIEINTTNEKIRISINHGLGEKFSIYFQLYCCYRLIVSLHELY